MRSSQGTARLVGTVIGGGENRINCSYIGPGDRLNRQQYADVFFHTRWIKHCLTITKKNPNAECPYTSEPEITSAPDIVPSHTHPPHKHSDEDHEIKLAHLTKLIELVHHGFNKESSKSSESSESSKSSESSESSESSQLSELGSDYY